MLSKNKSIRRPGVNLSNGFTMVELLVVIAVIGILATISVIGYGNWQKKLVETQVKSDLNGVAAAMESSLTFNNSYPTSIPANVTSSEGIKLSLYSSSGSNYCIDATSSNDSSVHYYIDESIRQSGAQEGSCDSRYKFWKQIASSNEHTCGISVIDNNAYCWGRNTYGQLGDNSIVDSFSPTAVDKTSVLNGKTIKSISASGYGYTCAIASDDMAYCWGNNNNGQLGNNSIIQSNVPVAVDTTGVLSNKTILSIATSSNGATCAIASDYHLYCWGININGEFGDGTTTNSLVPVAAAKNGDLAGKTIKMITAGSAYFCAVASDNMAYCWGNNSGGKLGNNSTVQSNVPVAVVMSGDLAGKTIKSISASSNNDGHTCFITSDNMAYCWGYNVYGQLGNGSTSNTLVPAAVDTTGVLLGKSIKSISNGYYYTCAIASDDNMYCWGYNFGRLGNNSTVQSSVPVAVYKTGALGGKTIKSLSPSFVNTTCAIASDNTAYCWGSNSFGQVGDGAVSSSPAPLLVDFSSNTVKSISNGFDHVCVINSNNNAFCWGSNGLGQIGNNAAGSINYNPTAVNTDGALNGKTTKLISNGLRYSCAIASDNNAYCWGTNTYGNLGNNSTAQSNVPVAVDTTGVLNSKTIKSISTGSAHTCVVASDDNAYCWGNNSNGQLGNNSKTQSKIPVAVVMTGALSGKTIKSISAGYNHTCVVASDDNAYCWGDSTSGQLGNNVSGGRPGSGEVTPVLVVATGVLSGKTIKSISAGYNHTCVVASDDNAYCWGDGSKGGLGNGLTAISAVPVAVIATGVLSGKTIKSISAGSYYTCAIASNDAIYCWGYNSYGQLGNNSTADSSVPVTVDISGVLKSKIIQSISASSNGSVCAIALDGYIYCWGNGLSGQLGNGYSGGRIVPFAVSSTVK